MFLRGRADKSGAGSHVTPRIMSQSVQTRKTILILHQQENDKQASVDRKKSFLPFSFISLRNVLSRPQSCTKKSDVFYSSSKRDSPCLAPIADIKTMLHAADFSFSKPARHLKANPPPSRFGY